jgi:Escherichia/Staphylococcus phage prohead protease
MSATQRRKELRFNAELRKSATGGRTLKGYAAKFNSRSVDLGGFVEQLMPGCFAESLSAGEEIRALLDHDHTKILARRSNGSLRISEDSVGLGVDFDVPATSYGDDLLACVDAGLIAGMSFGMYCMEDRWQDLQENGKPVKLRSVTRADLFEITATSLPAYPSTTLAARSFPDGMQHIEARMAGATLIVETAARKAKVAMLLQQCEDQRRSLVGAEMEKVDNQLKARLAFLKSL